MRNREGFSLIEIIVGMMIFVVAVLALASSTGFVAMQIQAADLRTERSVAYQQATERLHATDFDAIVTKAQGDAVTVGDYTVWWDVSSMDWSLKQVDLYTQGPAFRGGQRLPAVVDTVTIRIARLGR